MTTATGSNSGSVDGSAFNEEAETRQEEAANTFGSVAQGNFEFSNQPADTSTVTIKGVAVEFRTAPAAGKVTIGGTLALTLAALTAFLEASTNADIDLMSYRNDATKLYITSDLGGVAGNAYTLVASGNSNATASAATLAGGTSEVKWSTRIEAQYGTASPLPITGSVNA